MDDDVERIGDICLNRYDAFGNITKTGTGATQPVYSASTNRMTTLNGLTVKYDANGNLLSDGVNTYTWNADGNPTKLNSTTWTLDALGRPVEGSMGSGFGQGVYIPTGDRFALMTGQTFFRAWVPLPGGETAVYDYSVNNGLYFYRHPDWLGSSRVTSTPSRTFSETLAYMPFGETYLVDGSGDVDFTGQNSLNVNGVYDFPAREYSSLQGRWISPDPAGLAAVDSSDPQTWNRYAYVRNSPLNTTDPSGLDDNGDGDDNPYYNCVLEVFCTLLGYSINYTVPPSFLPNPTPPIDWQTILFGPLDPSLVIFNWAACYNVNGKLVQCSDPSAVLYCDDATHPDGVPTEQPSGACSNSIPQYAIDRQRYFALKNGEIGTPKTGNQCSLYQDGTTSGNALYKICQAFPNGAFSNKIRGCLQSLYHPGRGYQNLPFTITGVPLPAPSHSVDLNNAINLIPGGSAHLGCFENAIGLYP